MATGPIETILAALVSARVRFVVVGGVAVVLQGYPRFTVDPDLVVGFESVNVEMISMGSNEINLSLGVERKDEAAARLLHKALFGNGASK